MRRPAGLAVPFGSRIPRYPGFRPGLISFLVRRRFAGARDADRRPDGRGTRHWAPGPPVRGVTSLGHPFGSRIPSYPRFRPKPVQFIRRVARWGAECRSAAGWPRNSTAALSPASATCDKLGNSVRVADSQISTLSARPDPTRFIVRWPVGAQGSDRRPDGHETPWKQPHEYVRQGRGIHPGRGSHDIRALGPGRFNFLPDGLPGHGMPIDDRAGAKVDTCPPTSTRGMLRKSIRVTDPGISTLPAQSDLILYRTARWSTEGRSMTGWARSSMPELLRVRAACNKPRRTPSESRIPRYPRFRPNSVRFFIPGTECRPATGWARDPILALPRVRARCSKPGKSIGVADPEIRTPSAGRDLVPN